MGPSPGAKKGFNKEFDTGGGGSCGYSFLAAACHLMRGANLEDLRADGFDELGTAMRIMILSKSKDILINTDPSVHQLGLMMRVGMMVNLPWIERNGLTVWRVHDGGFVSCPCVLVPKVGYPYRCGAEESEWLLGWSYDHW